MNKLVAKTIFTQINSIDPQARARWGYNSPSCDSSSLTFKVKGSKVGYAYLKISLDPSDTYTIETFKVRKNQKKPLQKIDGIYANDLVDTIDGMVDIGYAY